MKNKLRDVALAIAILAFLCIVFWKIGWISSWKGVLFLYSLLAIRIIISIIADVVKTKFGK